MRLLLGTQIRLPPGMKVVEGEGDMVSHATRTLPASTSHFEVNVQLDQVQTTYWVQAPNEFVAVNAAVNKFMKALRLSRTHPGETLPLMVHVQAAQRPQSYPIEAN